MRKKILIVEDDTLILSVLEKKLLNCSFDVISGSDGKEGLKKALTEKPDLILLDIVMPIMDGLTFVDQYKEKMGENAVPIIILTNLDNADKINESREKGVNDYLVKTNWSLDEVVEKIKVTLEN